MTESERSSALNTDLSRRGFLGASGAFAGAGALAWLLAGCSSSGGSNPSRGSSGGASSDALKAATLSLAHDKASWKDWFQKESDAQSGAIKISWNQTPYSDSDAFRAAIRTSGRTSSAPDMFTWFTGEAMQELVDAKIVADVSAAWDKESDGFASGIKDLYTSGGKTYGAPLFVGPWIVYYNTALFNQYNLKAPTSFDDLTGMLAEIKGKGGVSPLGASVDWSIMYFQTLIVHTDPDLWNGLMAGTTPYDDPSVIDAMTIWKGWIDKGYFFDPSALHYGGPNGNNFAQYFAQKKIAMSVMATWYGPTMSTDSFKPGTDFGAFVFPSVKAGAKKAVAVEGSPLCVAANGKHAEDAMRSVEYFMSKEGYQTWVTASGLTSARSDVPSSSPVDVQVLADIKAGGYTSVQRIFEGTLPSVAQAVSDSLAKFMLSSGDPAGTMRSIQTQAKSLFAKSK